MRDQMIMRNKTLVFIQWLWHNIHQEGNKKLVNIIIIVLRVTKIWMKVHSGNLVFYNEKILKKRNQIASTSMKSTGESKNMRSKYCLKKRNMKAIWYFYSKN